MNYLRHLNLSSPSTMLYRSSSQSKMATVKPPNIFVYDGIDTETERYKSLKTLLESTMDSDRYTINHLVKEVLTQKPWSQHTQLLIITSETVDESLRKSIMDYVLNSGSLLTMNSDLDQEFFLSEASDFNNFVLRNGDLMKLGGKRVYAEVDGAIPLGTSGNAPVIMRTKSNDDSIVICTSVNYNTDGKFWSILLAELGIELRKSELPELTPIYAFNWLDDEDKMQQVVSCLTKKMAGGSSQVPVFTEAVSGSFNLTDYRAFLKTRILGHLLLFTDVIGSTNDTLESIMCQVPGDTGLTMIAGCQIKGRGRSGNAWLSPKGSALFSFLAKIPISSNLGRSIACVQHLAALAIVIAFQNYSGSKRLKLKWPNDIYTDDGRKLGGILVKSSVFQRDILCVIGCGVNVYNEKPTLCLNDLVLAEQEKISVEILIASALSEFEKLQNMFDQNRGEFLKLYYKNWLHSGQKVTLKSGEIEERAEILGLDENGYLRVRNEKGEIRSVHPDGNSLDMMHGLIYAKC